MKKKLTKTAGNPLSQGGLQALCFLFLMVFQLHFAGFASGSVSPRATAQDSDVYITAQLRAAISSHPSLSRRPIEIESKGQVVTLRGTVANELEARDLLVRARSIQGIRKLRLDLSVAPAAGTKWQGITQRAQKIIQEGREGLQEVREAADEVLKQATEDIFDTRITAAVRWKLLEEQKQAASGIHVETHRAVVVLSGRVQNAEDAVRAQQLAASVDNVVRVDSRLAIINPDTTGS